MTLQNFRLWLQGFGDAIGLTFDQCELIAEKAKTIEVEHCNKDIPLTQKELDTYITIKSPKPVYAHVPGGKK